MHQNLLEEDLQSKITNHIVIIGFSAGMEYFVQAVRETSDTPIVFLAEHEICDELLRICAKFNDVFHF